MTGPLVEWRFWSKVDKTPSSGCWEWTGALDSNGHGNVRVNKIYTKAHRLSFELNVGAIPPGQIVRHKCDNRKCVRPDHLELGTQLDNVRDMIERGRNSRGSIHSTIMKARGVRGELHPNSKLTEKLVREIIAASGTQKEIAARFGIVQSAVSNIRSGRRWAHLSEGIA